jgi:protein-tyrosine phosphatase
MPMINFLNSRVVKMETKVNSILFVCLGNICRSPLAEAIAKDLSTKYNLNLTVESAGTGDWHIGEAPCENSQKIAQLKNLDISNYKARQVNIEDFAKFDLIIGLDKSNIENLKKIGCKNPILLGDYKSNGECVPDPYFFDGFEGFEKVFEMIEENIEELFIEQFQMSLS